jgi:hypothetical protein
MNRQTALSGPHLDDGELVRYLDAEGHEPRKPGAGTSNAVAVWLDAAEFEAGPGASAAPAALADLEPAATRPAPAERQPRRHTFGVAAGGPWLKAAMITLLLAAPLAAIPSVRAWIADRVALVLADAPAATGAVDSPARAAVHASVIRFVPAPGAFLVTIDAPQAEGWLHLTRASGSEAVLEVRGSSPRPEPVVSASTLRIGNSAEMTASYALALPADVDQVYVDVAGSRLQLDAGDLASSIRIPLRPQGARR